MKPIDESSTLADLAKLREDYGITTMMLTILPPSPGLAHPPGRRFCSLFGPVFDCATGQGATEAEAIADAVRSIERVRAIATGGRT